jgi:hypothetical protein
MRRPLQVTTLLGIRTVNDVLAIAKVDSRWAAGRFGARIEFNNGNFILLPGVESAGLQRAGVIPAG